MNYFYINNIKINYIPNNRSIIEYCENLGIDIPHYCYHPDLSIAGNCRMCLIEVKNSPKPVISCAMSVLNKMEIFTDSPLVKKSREGILEFLLLNHPLDCPICDQGGECDLQDQSFVFGINKTRFYSYKRFVSDKNIGPIVKTVMTRCIHCTRCVRFSKEIAGVESLGVFGRGVNSEIGTYVTKTFNSELSGNIIDICPVGALTSKQYPFTSRNWELKNIKSIDYSDSSSLPIQVYVKSNVIVKIVPGYDSYNKCNNWISDKTRFSFDGMFSPERIVNCSIESGLTNKKNYKTWDDIFENIVYILYFKDHLSKHYLKELKLYIIFNDNIDLESLNLILFLSKKYTFIKLRKLTKNIKNIDQESKFLLNTFKNDSDLSKSNLCLLINTNPRYENSYINIKLRKRFLKGNFKIFNIGSLIDLTYPTVSLGSSINFIQKFVEGNNIFCQEFVNSNNPIFLTSSSIHTRFDSENLFKIISNLKNHQQIVNKNLLNFNVLNTTLNESGVNIVKSFKKFNYTDFSNSSFIYFIDNDFKSTSLNQLLELKLLNYFSMETKSKTIIELHSLFTGDFLSNIKQKLSSNIYISLPSKVFFEVSSTYLDNTGIYKKNIKILNSLNKSKENWQVIRKTLSSFNSINYYSIKNNNFLFYNTLNLKNFVKYLGFNIFSISSISSNKIFNENNNLSLNSLNFTFNQKVKFFKNKNIYWLEDFYLGGKDLYSRFSSTMIECSKSFRIEFTNFKYLI